MRYFSSIFTSCSNGFVVLLLSTVLSLMSQFLGTNCKKTGTPDSRTKSSLQTDKLNKKTKKI